MRRDKYLMSAPVSSWRRGGQALQREARSPCHFALLSRGHLPQTSKGIQCRLHPSPAELWARAQEWTRAVPRGTGDLSSGGLCLQTFLTRPGIPVSPQTS